MSIRLKIAFECLSQMGGVRLAEATNVGVVEQPSHFGRGGAKGDLYVLVEANGVTRNDVERMLVDAIASEYDRTGGSITANLRHAIGAANRRLYETNQKALPDMKATAGATCVVIRENDVFLAQAGPALAYLLHEGSLQRIPSDSPWLSPDRAASFPYMYDVGQRPDIDPDLFHSSLRPGDNLVICSCGLASRVSQDQVREAMSDRPASAVVDELAALVGSQDFCIVALEVMEQTEEEEASPEEYEAVSRRPQDAGFVGRLREDWRTMMDDVAGVLRGRGRGKAAAALPRRRPLSAVRGGAVGRPSGLEGQGRPAGATTARPEAAMRAEIPPAVPQEPPEPEFAGEPEPAPAASRPSARVTPLKAIGAGIAGVWQGARARIGRGRPEPRAELEPEGRAVEAMAEESELPPMEETFAPGRASERPGPWQPVEEAGPHVGAPGAGLPEESLVGVPWRGTARARERPAVTQERRAPLAGLRWQVLVLAGVAIIALLVGANLFSRYQEEQARNRRFTELLAQAQESRNRVTPSLDRTTARVMLGQAQQALTEALQLRPDDPEATGLYESIQTTLDSVNAVVRLSNVTTLAEVPETQASLGRLVINGIDVYFLDVGQNRVYKYLLTAPGANTVQKLDVNPVLMRKGDEVGGVVLGDILDLVWMPPGGVRRAGRFLALESGGNLLEYDPAVGLRPLVVKDSQTWRRPKAVGSYEGRFYLLDTQQSKILRYDPTAKGYEMAPAEWLRTPTDLTNVVDMAIDGDIYLLGLDGKIARFGGGQPLPFPLVDLDRPMSNPASIFAAPETKWVYVVDPGNKRVVQLGKEGGFIRQFRYAGQDGAFDALRSVYVDEERGRMYVTSGKRVLVAELPRP